MNGHKGIWVAPGHKTLNFYVSASLNDIATARRVMTMLEQDFGMSPAFRWRTVDLADYPHQAAKEVAAVHCSELFIGLLPGRLGSQAEIGLSLMRKRYEPTRIVLWAPSENVFNEGVEGLSPYPNVFWHHPQIERVIGEDPVEAVKEHFMRDDRNGW